MRLLPLLLLPGCSIFAGSVPKTPPALYDMEEPLALFQEPADEQERRELPKGGFTGVHAAGTAETLEDLDADAAGILVGRVVENSPAAFAGLEKGDIVLEVDGKPLSYPSEWRNLELEAKPGDRWKILYDRAGAERETELAVEERARPSDRHRSRRFREESRVGVVLRTATEVEARAAGLGPGGGAVVVGLSRRSPWRAAGIRFGDLIVEAAGKPVAHPNVVLEAIRATEPKERIALALMRGENRLELEPAVSRRVQEAKVVDIPLLYYFERDRDRTVFSVLLGIVKRTRTKAAAELRLLWIFKLRSGDADVLEEVEEPRE